MPADAGLGAGERGLFVVFEGGDGAGKSTQVADLARWLAAAGRPVVVTREPGGTRLGYRLRELLLDPDSRIEARAELLLYCADRAQHAAEVIRPALAAGAVVISDRFSDSTAAYQAAGRNLALADVVRLSDWAADGLVADLVVLLDIDPSVAALRRTSVADRLEAAGPEFHARVREQFLALARSRPASYLVLDATLPASVLASRVRDRVAGELAGPRPEGW